MSLELETGSQQESFQLWNVVVSNTTITVKKLFGTKLLNLYELDGLQIWQLMLSTMHMVDTYLESGFLYVSIFHFVESADHKHDSV